MSTMKAIQISTYNEPYKVHNDVPIPSPKPHQVLIRIKAAGFCHTDLMALNGEFGTKLPFVGSHEPAGVVVDVGGDVKGFEKGDRVGCINFDSVCGMFLFFCLMGVEGVVVDRRMQGNAQTAKPVCLYTAITR